MILITSGLLLIASSTVLSNDLLKIDEFPETCSNMYFNERYKGLISDPEGFVTRKEKIESTILPESNNYGTCYANSVANIYEGFDISPHPYYTAILSKTFFGFINKTVSGGYMYDALLALNNKARFCDHKTFNNYFQFNKNNPADKFLYQLNANNLLRNHLVYPDVWSLSARNELYNYIIQQISIRVGDLSLEAYLQSLTPIQVQEFVMKIMCEKADAFKSNPLFGQLNLSYSTTPYTGQVVENFLGIKEKNIISSNISNSTKYVPSFFDQIGNSYDISDDKTSFSFHAYSILGTRYKPGSKNSRPQCQVILKDSNPHYNENNCKTSGEITRIYDSNNHTCYILTSFHLLKTLDENKPRLNFYTSVN